MDFQLQSNLLGYEPDEEERRRTAALAALAAQSTPEDSAMSPGGLALDPEFQMEPVPEPPTDRAISALASMSLPEPMAAPMSAGDDEGAELMPDNEAAEGEAPPLGAAPAKGVDSAVASPEMKEVTNPEQGTSKVEPPPAPDPFEALMLRGQEMQRRQLEAYDKRGAPGVNGWAILADVALNKGRSIPGILQQADSDKRSFEEGRRKLMTGGAHSDPVNQMLAMQRIQTAQGREGRLTQTAASKATKDALAAEASKGSRAAMLELMKLNGADPAKIEAAAGLDDKGWAQAMPSFRRDYNLSEPMVQKAGHAEEVKAAGRATGTIEAENAAKDTKADTVYTTETARRKAEAEQLGTRPQTPDQIAADKLQREGLDEQKRARVAAEGARTDAAAARKEEKNRAWITEYGNKHIKQIDTASLVDELDDVIAAAERDKKLPPGLGVEQLKEGVDKYPLGQTARGIAGLVAGPEYNKFQAEADYNRKLLNRLGESVYRIDTGASGNEREEMRAAIASAQSPMATLQDIKDSVKILRMRLTSQLGNTAAAAPDLAAQALAGGNIRDPQRWIGHLRAAPSPTAADPTLAPGQTAVTDPETGDEVIEGAAAGGPDENNYPTGGSGANGNLGTTSKQVTRAPVSQVVQRPQARTRTVTIVYDDGTQEVAEGLDDTAIAQLRGKRGVVEVR